MTSPTGYPLRVLPFLALVACALVASPRTATAGTADSLTALPPARHCGTGDSARVSLRLPCDSTSRLALRFDSTNAPQQIVTIPRAVHTKARIVFFTGVAGALAANYRMKLDQDPGGYTDAWTTSSMFPDKGVHGLAAFALTSVGVDLGVRPWTSAMTICAAGVAFEYTQGYVSRYDIGADCIGASGAALWRSFRGSRGNSSR
jgi:hypothetical protein